MTPTLPAAALCALGLLAAPAALAQTGQDQTETGQNGIGQTISADDLTEAMTSLGFATLEPNFLSVQGVGGARTAPGGTLFFSISGSDRRPSGLRQLDGSLSFGAGFGDQETGIGGDVAIEITSAEATDFADSGYVSAKIGGRVLRDLGQNYLAVGAEGLAPWGDARGRAVNMTLTGTHVTRLGPFANGQFYPLMISVGYGDHQKDGTDPGAFVGIGLGLTPHLSVSVADDAGVLKAGLGMRFDRFANTVFMLTAHDLARSQGESRISFAVGISTDKLFGKDRP